MPVHCVDLHSHSQASDGTLTPAALVEAANAAGVDTLALTDHDTLDGLDQAFAKASELGMRLIPGVEISVTWQKRTLHVVGLNVSNSSVLSAGLHNLQVQRARRAETIAAKLQPAGLKNALERARHMAAGGQITRTHFARLLVADGLCKNGKQAFKRYLKPGKPGYAKVQWAGLGEAIHWIQAAGGLAVLAHPHGYNMSHAWRQRTVAAFAGAGGDALEICTGTTTPRQVDASAADARQHGLAGSVGSDFHSPEQRWLALGRLAALPADLSPVWEHPAFG